MRTRINLCRVDVPVLRFMGSASMINELERLVERICDEELRGMVREFLEIPEVGLEGEKLPLDVCPGGAYIHHAYEGGLLQHIVAVTRLCMTLCDLIEEIYGGSVNRDTVLAGAILHDVMKCYAYCRDGEKRFMTSQMGERVDHLSLVVAELYHRGFPVDIIHVAASHHGDKGPVKPKTLEALIVSVADLADSELSRQTLRAAEYLVRKSTGERRIFRSSEEALEVIRVKAQQGWEGLAGLGL